jgi:hypothetical protein
MENKPRLRRGISILTLGVKNLEQSIEFYQNLGWELSEDSDPKMCTFIKTPNSCLGLVEYDFLAKDIGIACPPKRDYSGFTMAINGENPEEVDQIFHQAIEAGARCHEYPHWKDWGGNKGYSGYFQDPDGYYWEVAYAPFCTLGETGTLLPK